MWTRIVAASIGMLALLSPARSDERQAYEIVAQLGHVKRDETRPEKPVVQVNFTAQPAGRSVKDAELVHLGAFKHLRVLYLSYSDVTDAGMVHLKGLRSLEELSFADTRVTDAGMVHLKGLSNLKKVGFPFTRGVTDRGLRSLHGLKKLEQINVAGTGVTAKGIAAFQKALPKCYVIR